MLAGATTQADHLTLQQHLLDIAAENDAEASRHAAMAQTERNDPNPGAHVPGSAALRVRHCDRLAASSRAIAQDARAAASDHALMATAIAQDDHATRQCYFTALAGTYDAAAARHADMAQANRKNANRGSHFPGTGSLRAQQHGEQLSASLRDAAIQARERASAHTRLTSGN